MANSYNNGTAAGGSIVTGAFQNADGVIFGVESTLKKGEKFKSRGDTVSNAVDSNIMLNDVDQATKFKVPDAPYAYNDRTVSNPSGLTVLGVPTWDDGKIARNTVYGADHERTTGGEITYLQSGKIKQVDYSALST